jgi:hypothetical protein
MNYKRRKSRRVVKCHICTRGRFGNSRRISNCPKARILRNWGQEAQERKESEFVDE